MTETDASNQPTDAPAESPGLPLGPDTTQDQINSLLTNIEELRARCASLEQQQASLTQNRTVLRAQLQHVAAVAQTCINLHTQGQDPGLHMRYIIDLINSPPVQAHMGEA